MKTQIQISLFTVAALVGGAAIFWPETTPGPTPAKRMKLSQTARAAAASELAAPLLHREFTASCVRDKAGVYRETLRFAEDGTTTFTRHFYTDPGCRDLSQRESVQEGRYVLAEEEAGQILLIIRNLYDKKTEAITPYFEALSDLPSPLKW
jgi:hypothetical protein